MCARRLTEGAPAHARQQPQRLQQVVGEGHRREAVDEQKRVVRSLQNVQVPPPRLDAPGAAEHRRHARQELERGGDAEGEERCVRETPRRRVCEVEGVRPEKRLQRAGGGQGRRRRHGAAAQESVGKLRGGYSRETGNSGN